MGNDTPPVACVQDILVNDMLDTEVATAAEGATAEAPGGGAGGGKGLKANAVKFGQFLYGGKTTWGYMPTC